MGVDTLIEWTHHTFNPWRGCTKVSPGCAHCYAEAMSGRNPKVLGEWGPAGKRVVAAESYWRQPIAWDRAAAEAGERRRVFCASLADVFEDRDELHAPRARLFRLIEATPNLDWLLLTKRPKIALEFDEWFRLTPNVWLGVSVEDQARADERIPHLLWTPAAVRFLSCEPLLGPIDLSAWIGDDQEDVIRLRLAGLPYERQFLHWVIVGGESGPGARPMHPAWARSLRDQCQAAGVAFFFKQWGEWAPSEFGEGSRHCPPPGERSHYFDDPPYKVWRYGKKLSGRRLDGREWSEFPLALARSAP